MAIGSRGIEERESGLVGTLREGAYVLSIGVPDIHPSLADRLRDGVAAGNLVHTVGAHLPGRGVRVGQMTGYTSVCLSSDPTGECERGDSRRNEEATHDEKTKLHPSERMAMQAVSAELADKPTLGNAQTSGTTHADASCQLGNSESQLTAEDVCDGVAEHAATHTLSGLPTPAANDHCDDGLDLIEKLGLRSYLENQSETALFASVYQCKAVVCILFSCENSLDLYHARAGQRSDEMTR